MIDQILSPTKTSPASGADPANLEKVREAAEEFESVFLSQVLNGLTQGMTGEGPLSNADSDPFSGLLQQEYAKLISRSGGVGVADAVMSEMLKMQEVG